jgi:hypothetical protein
MMSRLDGNSVAGVLAELFAVDVTTAIARCAGCGAMAELATAMVYADAAGAVVRCARCDAVLATIVQAPDRLWFGMPGISAIEVRR